MASIRKSFNFRTGLQVDNDNFVVNANGLVGIGTSIPQNYLFNVHGDTRVTGLVTTGELYAGIGTVGVLSATDAVVSGILTVGQLRIGSSGLVDNVIGYARTTFITDNAGVGFHTTSKLGINTTTSPGSSDVEFKVHGNADVTGILTASTLSGTLPVTDLSGTLTNAQLPTDINKPTGIITASSFVGSLTGTATTASSLTGSPSITVTDVSASNVSSGVVTATTELNVGTGGTALTALSTGRLGIGTALPTSEIQVRKASGSLVEVVSDSGQARISVGQVTGVGNSTGVLRFGNVNKTLDLVNKDTGNLNFILHGGSAGVDTGRFDWLYGQDIVSPLMSLTYEGDLGIGKTNPTNTLHVVGTSTVTSTAYFGGDVRAKKIYFTELVDGVVKTNANITSGISTFNKVYLTGGDNVLSINSNTPTGSNKFYIADSTDAYLGNQASMGSPVTADANYFASNLGADAAQLKVYGNSYVGSDLYVRGSFNFNGTLNLSDASTISVNSASDALRITQTGTGNALVVEDSANPDATAFIIDNGGKLGVGTDNPNGHGLSLYNSSLQLITSGEGGGFFGGLTLSYESVFDAYYILNWTKPLYIGGGDDVILQTGSNKVGIGSTTPTEKLDVNGNVKVSGITTSTGGFTSGGPAVEISVTGSTLTFTVPGVGSTSLNLI